MHRYVMKFPRPQLDASGLRFHELSYYAVGWSHALPGGHCVLRGEASWRTINGVWLSWPRGQVWLLFRRTYPRLGKRAL